jgi:hypothetical protein
MSHDSMQDGKADATVADAQFVLNDQKAYLEQIDYCGVRFDPKKREKGEIPLFVLAERDIETALIGLKNCFDSKRWWKMDGSTGERIARIKDLFKRLNLYHKMTCEESGDLKEEGIS